MIIEIKISSDNLSNKSIAYGMNASMSGDVQSFYLKFQIKKLPNSRNIVLRVMLLILQLHQCSMPVHYQYRTIKQLVLTKSQLRTYGSTYLPTSSTGCSGGKSIGKLI